MNAIEYIESRNAFSLKADNLIYNLDELNGLILSLLKPPPGPYLLIHYISYVRRMIYDLKIIIARLYNTRIELFKSDLLMSLPSRSRIISLEEQEILNQSKELHEQITLDFQSMLLFSSIALDDWARIYACILGDLLPKKRSFVEMIVKDQGRGLSKVLWDDNKKEILWLDAFSRLYRNKMIVHRSEPWQISSSRSLGDLSDWKLFTPIAAGWIKKEIINEAQQKLQKIAIKYKISLGDHIHGLIYNLLQNVFELSQEERKAVYDAAERFGFNTPSFPEFSHKLINFLNMGTLKLLEIAKNNSASINIGAPEV